MTIDVVVRELTPGDAEQFHAFAAHPLVLPTVDAAQVPSVEDVRTFVTQLAAQPDSPRKERAIVLDGEVVGSIGLTIEGSEGELGYVVHPDHWGRGVATQAAMLMVRQGFAELGLTRIYATVSTENPASVRVLEKAGFRQVDAKTWAVTR
ncbi:MAG: GNAT family N-acetyltransferase [Hamadaea sp.]|uniref:GNAT family N-acetyltransferase n=1 Tax=Hamadaea sp. TaxID=2024425 RepID=UPI0017BE5DEC|nr:GNAT family N-acetyltransferase [Hamadaea sp.]NUR74201.1 GNAT family N-acetyltransferase [Hamadaea sp.]NUT22289.1 GNAT family N-acetyltransferase [Hamadaea sp.]